MRKTAVLEADHELSTMLSKEQRGALRKGGRVQRREQAPLLKPSPEALAEERAEVQRRGDRELVIQLIRDLNKEYGVGGGNMDLKKGSALSAA